MKTSISSIKIPPFYFIFIRNLFYINISQKKKVIKFWQQFNSMI